MDRFTFLAFNGLTLGAIYAAVALALVLIWRSTRVLNFAQGAMAIASAYLALTVSEVTGSYWLGLAAALVGGLLVGAIVERAAFRGIENAPPLNSVVIGVGLLVFIEATAGMVYGSANRHFPAALDTANYRWGDVALFSPQDVFTVGSVLCVVVGLALLFGRTGLGLRMRAAAFEPEVARLLGVRVGRLLTLGWALAGLVGALAGMLVIPTGLGLYPQAMDAVLVLGFTAAVVGGLDSPQGAVLGGLLTGLAISFASGYLGSDITSLAVFALLLAVLLVRPAGLFAAARARRV